MQPVKIYTTQTCGFCKMAKQFFKEHNVEYTEHDVGTDVVAREEMMKKSGQSGVPVIEVGQNIVVGFDQEHLSHLLGISS